VIEHLSGTVYSKESNHVVLKVAGVGYGLDVPQSTFITLPAVGEEAALYAHLYVQEQVLRLYGFATIQEREIFEVFLGLSGIGPKTALAILSAIEINTFAAAILRNDLAVLTKLPGVGKKTAERLVLELRDKIATFAGAETAGAARAINALPTELRETIQALEALGCKLSTAERASQKAYELLGAGAQVADLVREALKHRHL
jgi:Holliday junction DNA helicase RuvA